MIRGYEIKPSDTQQHSISQVWERARARVDFSVTYFSPLILTFHPSRGDVSGSSESEPMDLTAQMSMLMKISMARAEDLRAQAMQQASGGDYHTAIDTLEQAT